MKRIAIDVDDVIAAFTPHVHSFFGVLMEKTDYWSVPNMDARLGKDWFSKITSAPEFWDTLPVLNPTDHLTFDFHYYISSFPQEMYYSRMRWLEKHGFPARPLIVTSNKLEECRRIGVDILIDDKPEMMEILKGTEVRGIHYINHYAGFDPVGEYVTDLRQVKEKLCIEQHLFMG